MKNIYRRNSKLTSYCTRLLIERYVAGDTAVAARSYLEGHEEPLGCECSEVVDPFLAIYPSSIKGVQSFVALRRGSGNANWRRIRISRQCVNNNFLWFGRFLWDIHAGPYLRAEARKVVSALEEVCCDAEWDQASVVHVLTERMARRYVQYANGLLLETKGRQLRYGAMADCLAKRARSSHGLCEKHGKEHVSWAFLVSSVKNTRGFDDRAYAARYLSERLVVANTNGKHR